MWGCVGFRGVALSCVGLCGVMWGLCGAVWGFVWFRGAVHLANPLGSRAEFDLYGLCGFRL